MDQIEKDVTYILNYYNAFTHNKKYKLCKHKKEFYLKSINGTYMLGPITVERKMYRRNGLVPTLFLKDNIIRAFKLKYEIYRV